MMSLESYEKEKAKLQGAYDLLLKTGFFTDERYIKELRVDEMTIGERKSNLESQKFYLAVVGQMKAGKSTLLNAMIFGRPVLPDDDLVMTAKITYIEYSDREQFEVVFYSREEYDQVKQQLSYNDDFEKEIELVFQEYGVRPSDVRDTGSKILYNLEELPNYLAVPKRGGKYSPFVKHVTVRYPHEWLKHVVVVDTPGLNDPITFREDITKKELGKANAVIYVTFAGMAFAAPDFEYMGKFLFHIEQGKRITAVNKIDTVDNEQALNTFIKGLGKHENQTVRDWVNHDSVINVSALAGLIARMKDKGIKLSPELREYQEMLNSYLAPERNKIDELQRIVEEKLVSNKYDDYIDSHSRFIHSTCERLTQFIELEIRQRRSYSDELKKSAVQQQEKIDKIKKAKVKVTETYDVLFNEAKNNLDKRISDMVDCIEDNGDKQVKEFEGWLSRQDTIHKIATNTADNIIPMVRNQNRFASAQLNTLMTGVIKEVDNASQKMSEVGGFREDASMYKMSLKFAAMDFKDKFRDAIKKLIDEDEINESILKASNEIWPDFLYASEEGLNLARKEAKRRARKIMEDLTKQIGDQLKNHILPNLGTLYKKIEKRMVDAFNNKEAELKELIEGKVDKEIRQKSLVDDIKQLEEHLTLVGKHHKQIQAALSDTGRAR